MKNILILFKKYLDGSFTFQKAYLVDDAIDVTVEKFIGSGVFNGSIKLLVLNETCEGKYIDENGVVYDISDIDTVRIYFDEDETQDVVFAFWNNFHIDIDGKIDKYSNLMQAESGSKTQYQKYFTGKLQKYGVESPAELSDKQKSKFFDEVDKGWNGKNE